MNSARQAIEVAVCLLILLGNFAAPAAGVNEVDGAKGVYGDGGLATDAQLFDPEGVSLDVSGNIFIADDGNNLIRKVVAKSGIIQTVAGNGIQGFGGDDRPATSAQLFGPSSVFVDGFGNIFIADSSNLRIREVVAGTGIIKTVAGNGIRGFAGDGELAAQGQFLDPTGVFVDPFGNIFFADALNFRIREVVAKTGNLQTVAGSGDPGGAGDGEPAINAHLNRPTSVFVDRSGNIFFSDALNFRIREVVAKTGIMQTVAGDGTEGGGGDGGPATKAQINVPAGIYLDRSGNIFTSDALGCRVREVIAKTGIIRTVAGNGTEGFGGDGGPATEAKLDVPLGLFVDPKGDIFIADSNNERIREVVAATGKIRTVAGNGTVPPVAMLSDRASPQSYPRRDRNSTRFSASDVSGENHHGHVVYRSVQQGSRPALNFAAVRSVAPRT